MPVHRLGLILGPFAESAVRSVILTHADPPNESIVLESGRWREKCGSAPHWVGRPTRRVEESLPYRRSAAGFKPCRRAAACKGGFQRSEGGTTLGT